MSSRVETTKEPIERKRQENNSDVVSPNVIDEVLCHVLITELLHTDYHSN